MPAPHRSFTLLELIVVIVVLGVLAALALPTFDSVISRARSAQEQATLGAVLRDASALAAMDGRGVPSLGDVTTALGEVAHAPGLNAAGFSVCEQSAFDDASCSPTPGTTTALYAASPTRAALALLGETCTLGYVQAGRVLTWDGSHLPDCAATAALAGKTPGAPASLSLSFDEQSREATLHWRPGPGPRPQSYQVSFSPEGTGMWFPSVGSYDPTGPSFTGVIPAMYDPLVGTLRVTAVGEDGSESPPSDLPVVFPPAPLAPSARFLAPDPLGSLVYDHDELVAKGLDTFPDGLVSALPTATPGVYEFYANQGDASDGNGGSLGTGFVRTRGTLGDPFDEVLATRGDIDSLQVPVDYLGGGAVWKDPTSNLVVMLYHREIYTRSGGTPTGAFWSSIGVAYSTDGGDSFTDAGEVLTPDIALGSPNRGPSGNGPGDLSTVARDGYLYAYYNDNLEDGSMVLAVARTSLEDLADTALTAEAPVFSKYHAGSFSSPGLGGTATAVSEGFNPSIAWSECREEFIMVSTGYTSTTASMLQVATSSDGLSWTTPEPLYPELAPFRIYNTLLGDTVDAQGNRVVTGDQLRVLAVDFTSDTDFWSAHAVRLVAVTDSDATAGCVG